LPEISVNIKNIYSGVNYLFNVKIILVANILISNLTQFNKVPSYSSRITDAKTMGKNVTGKSPEKFKISFGGNEKVCNSKAWENLKFHLAAMRKYVTQS
jgi:hypothetical protein